MRPISVASSSSSMVWPTPPRAARRRGSRTGAPRDGARGRRACSLRGLGLGRHAELMATNLRRYHEAGRYSAGAGGAEGASSSSAPAVGDLTDEQLLQILAQKRTMRPS
ncbi:hypothetical protein ACP70R_026305 [Stipagrostis hirtigluma subsp. patula]